MSSGSAGLDTPTVSIFPSRRSRLMIHIPRAGEMRRPGKGGRASVRAGGDRRRLGRSLALPKWLNPDHARYSLCSNVHEITRKDGSECPSRPAHKIKPRIAPGVSPRREASRIPRVDSPPTMPSHLPQYQARMQNLAAPSIESIVTVRGVCEPVPRAPSRTGMPSGTHSPKRFLMSTPGRIC